MGDSEPRVALVRALALGVVSGCKSAPAKSSSSEGGSDSAAFAGWTAFGRGCREDPASGSGSGSGSDSIASSSGAVSLPVSSPSVTPTSVFDFLDLGPLCSRTVNQKNKMSVSL
jgi:hypothetical protein